MSLALDHRANAPGRWTVAAFIVGTIAIGGLVGALNVPDGWYRALDKPGWNPPDWVFGPVWTALYAMVGYAGARVRARREALGALHALWWAQLALNLAWTPIFFTLHSLAGASVEIALLLLVVLAFLALAWRGERVSFWLFVPYAAWVGFASILTWTITAMN